MRWIAATLLGLLALAYALIVFAAPSAEVHPAPNDRGLGGLSLLAGALRAKGYRLVFDPSSKPRLGKADVAVVPLLGTRAVPKNVLAFVRTGGRAIVFSVPEQLQSIAGPQTVRDVLHRSATVDETASMAPNPSSPPGMVAPVAAWRDEDDDSMASLSQLGKGRMARLAEGALATNRFLGRRDNARVVLATVGSVARPGDRLVFVADGYGEAEDLGPVEAIGSWAVGALWQSLAVLAAFGAARGIRFGLPSSESKTRKGSRELLDVLAGHYRRGRHTEAPLLAAARERPDDAELQAFAARVKVAEGDARRVLIESEARPRSRRQV